MTILLEGLNRIRDLHRNDIAVAHLGTDGSAATEPQTGLLVPESASERTPSLTASIKTNTLNYSLPSTQGTDVTYREFGTFRLSPDIDFDRSPFPGVLHTATKNTIITKLYFYEQR